MLQMGTDHATLQLQALEQKTRGKHVVNKGNKKDREKQRKNKQERVSVSSKKMQHIKRN